MSYWFINSTNHLPEGDAAGHGVGLLLISFAVVSTYMTFAAWRVTKAMFLVFLTLVPAFVGLGVGAYSGSEVATHIGAYFGFACALLAWYHSAAIVLNHMYGRTLRPLGPAE